MYFQDFSSFMAMGGHGVFVWSAYGAAFLVIIYNLWAPLMTRKKLVIQLRRQQQLQASQQRNVRVTITVKKTPSSIQAGHHKVAGEKESL